MDPKPVRRSRRRARTSVFDRVLIEHLENFRGHGSEAVRRSRLKVRDKLKPFLPYLDRPQATGNAENTARPLSAPNAAWISLDLIRGWLDGCQSQHADRCQPANHSPGSPRRSPAWLIDVDRLCLVKGEPEMQYMALSYVWGTSNSACTETANLALLQQPGGLEDAVQMPKTITHAVQLTKLLGEHYLWADRFCIVQDGGQEKQDQLDAMGDIYTKAFATIVVATVDDANHGLRGIPGVTSRRFLPGHGHSSPGNPDPYSPTVDSDPGSSTSLAGVSSIGPGPANATTIRTPSARGSHGSETLGALISELDLDGDSPHSHDIEQQARSSSDDLGSIYSQVDRIEDERPDVKSDEEILVEQAHLLMGSIWYSRGWTFQEQMFSHRKMIFQGETVNWECCCAAWHEAQGLQVTGVDSKRQEEHQETQTLIPRTGLSPTTWPDLRRFARLVPLLPEGWTSHRCDKSGKPFFRHASDPDQEFWYPIPLRKATDPLAPHIRAKHLWCTTRRAVVRIGATFHNDTTGQCLCAELVDDEDNWVGVLRYVTLGIGAAPRCSSHELIELSAGSVEDQETEAVSFDEWFRPGCPRRRGRYEFYNVMAIRWDGITAYRLAVGRVEKTAWERLATDEACVTLG